MSPLSAEGAAWYLLRHVPPKRQLTFNGLHGVISKNIIIIIIIIIIIYLTAIGFLAVVQQGHHRQLTHITRSENTYTKYSFK
jgi:hypothetical protein